MQMRAVVARMRWTAGFVARRACIPNPHAGSVTLIQSTRSRG